jgi:predicted amidohydrolase
MASFVFTLCVWAAVLVVCKAGGTLSLWDSLNVGVVQYPLVGLLSVDQLTYKVRQYVAAAAEQDTQLLVLPELFSLDLLNYSIPETDQFDSVIDQIFPEFINNLQQLSVEFNMYILAGSVPAKVQKQIRNRSYLLAPNGKQVYQEKLFLTPDEVDWGWEGSDELSVIDTPWVSVRRAWMRVAVFVSYVCGIFIFAT